MLSGLFGGMLCFCKIPCTGLDDMFLQHGNFIQTLFIDGSNLESGHSNAQKSDESPHLGATLCPSASGLSAKHRTATELLKPSGLAYRMSNPRSTEGKDRFLVWSVRVKLGTSSWVSQ